MASLPPQADAIRLAVSSVQTCSPATTVAVRDLLLSKDETTAPASDSRATKTAKATRPKTTTATKSDTRKEKASGNGREDLSVKEKAALATQIVNAALKALQDAAKPAPVPPTPSRRPTDEGLVRTAVRNALRRSSSAPMTPLQSRTVNRISTSPVATKQRSRSPIAPTNTTNTHATAECAHIAFAALRSLLASGKINLPELQLEMGISSLVGKLINLGMYEQALKELRILQPRLARMSTPETKIPSKPSAKETKTAVPQGFAELLDFGDVKATGPTLMLIVSSQMQALRILAATKKSSRIEAAMPYLRPDCKSSPVTLLLAASQEPKADVSKIARQMESLAQILLSLTPSVSSKEDATAIEPRLSVSPATAMELQANGLECRIRWWKLVNHQADVDKEIISPFSKCLAAYIRRGKDGPKSTYANSVKAFDKIDEQLQAQGLHPSTGSKFPMSTIYQALTTLARESGTIARAVVWATKLRKLLDPKVESAAKLCSIASQLLALHLKNPDEYIKDDGLIQEVAAGIQGPLRGDTTELEELLANVCLVRKSSVTLLLLAQSKEDTWVNLPSSAASKELLASLVLQCPRFSLRWLGKSPEPKSSTKDFLRYEQRRQLLGKSIHHTLDSALMMIKTRLDAKKLTWELMDTILHDCLTLLAGMGDASIVEASTSYHAKISHFYYLQYNALRQQNGADSRDSSALRALRRSIDCVKHRSGEEREKAHLSLKLERMAELCKSFGRTEDALAALQSIRSSMVEDRVLEEVAHALTTKSVNLAWSVNEKADVLSRTLTSISKMEQVWMDWTTELSEAEQAAAFEQRLHFALLAGGNKTEDVTLEHPTVDALLRIYVPTRFPIRRLRVLLHLLGSTVGNNDLAMEMESIVKDAAQVEEHDNLGEDSALASFIPHMRALYTSITGLLDSYSDPDRLRSSLKTWQSIIDTSASKAEVEGAIDDIPALLNHLQSASDFLRMKGQDILLSEVLELSANLSHAAQGPRPDDLVRSRTALALQYVALGQSSKADAAFQQTSEYGELHPDLSGEARAVLHLSWTEFLMTMGNFQKAEDHLSQAKLAFMDPQTAQQTTRMRKKALYAHASYLHSLLALERGDSHQSLVHSKNGVRTMIQDWMRLESQVRDGDVKEISVSEEESSLHETSREEKGRGGDVPASGPEFWNLFHPLIKSITGLSAIYAHLGLYQETMYYAEQAQKIARQTGSEIYIAQCAAWMGSVFAKAADQAKSLEMMDEAAEFLQGHNSSYLAAVLAAQMSSAYQGLNDADSQRAMITKAEAVMDSMAAAKATVHTALEESETSQLEARMAKLEIKEKPARGSRKTVKSETVKKPARPTKATKTKPTAIPKQIAPAEDLHVSSLRAGVLIQKAAALLRDREWAQALSILGDVKELAKTPALLSSEQVAMASCFIGMSIDKMAHDAVFSVIQDSTISFPSICGGSSDRTSADRLSLTKVSPPKKGRNASAGQKEGIYVEYLKEAQAYLTDAQTVATHTGDGSLVHRISGMLQNVALLLSATSAKNHATQASSNATFSIELGRNLTWRRERKAILLEKTAKADVGDWPAALSVPESRRSSLGTFIDMGRFQKDYVDILPASWNVLSISVSENKHDLCITKLQAGSSPFVIRLPLERASSRDADTEVFNFQQGRAELIEIIKLANETCHDARDFSAKGAKLAWWADREALDARLKELLENIEQIWLGGFRGIFSQHQRRPEHLARFQKSLTTILDKHLPSRQQVRGRRGKAAAGTPAPKVTLDLRVLELFIGLGDATVADCDFDEALTDLLYFVVDILQFHGERNAYDEIDFDSMVVETFDALQAYHATVRANIEADRGIHTVLVLDKALHVFPWESLPCMQDTAVSRVPSLACLRRLILEQQPPRASSSSAHSAETHASPSHPAGHHASIASGTYILNPGSDLKSTQEVFSAPLAKHLPSASWTRISQREPSESEFENALSSSDILLYFGHGSGAQYIRGRTVRRLEKCRATAMLMGCSSASLTDAGEFEVHGPVWNYLMAGCPAVVGTLWDVTDRDIDRFAGRVFEEWGLMPAGTFREDKAKGALKGKDKAGAKGTEAGGGAMGDKTSLVEAVAVARDACRFRYLTAAAVAVYGIPVYVDR